MACLAQGDRSAFPVVFRELWPRVRALCLSLLRNGADADEAAQRSMEKVFVRASDYDGVRPALTWVLAIAAWECRTVARQRQRRREVDGDAILEDERATAEQDFVRNDLQRAAVEALGHLSQTDRQVLIDAYWDEANAGAPALRKRRQRALERLRMVFRRLYESE